METLAIFYALRRFRVYAGHRAFLIVGSSLVQTLRKNPISPGIARWSLDLEDLYFLITVSSYVGLIAQHYLKTEAFISNVKLYPVNSTCTREVSHLRNTFNNGVS